VLEKVKQIELFEDYHFEAAAIEKAFDGIERRYRRTGKQIEA